MNKIVNLYKKTRARRTDIAYFQLLLIIKHAQKFIWNI